MKTPNIRYYARLMLLESGNKTPKYRIVVEAGYYQPMEHLKNKKGFIEMYLMPQIRNNLNAPAMRLQAKASLNFTGLYDYFNEGKLTGYAYGYPLNSKRYGGKNAKLNPFYDYQNDCFLFIVDQSKNMINGCPHEIELLVIENGKPLATGYVKMLAMGGFDDDMKLIRQQTRSLM